MSKRCGGRSSNASPPSPSASSPPPRASSPYCHERASASESWAQRACASWRRRAKRGGAMSGPLSRPTTGIGRLARYGVADSDRAVELLGPGGLGLWDDVAQAPVDDRAAALLGALAETEIGRAHVCSPVTCE